MKRPVAIAVFCLAVMAGGTIPAIALTRKPGNVLITITCTNVHYAFSGFPAGNNRVSERISIDDPTTTAAHVTFTFTGPSASNDVPITVPSGIHTVIARADWGAQTNAQTTLNCPATPCPPGTQVHLRWHYQEWGATTTSGSWSATQSATCPGSWTFQQQAMEGNLHVAPGTIIRAGYDITVPGNSNPNLDVTVNNPQVVFSVACVSGATPSSSTWTLPMPTQIYAVPDTKWYPSGSQAGPLVYQSGKIAIPDFCAGGTISLAHGGTFSASVS
jgi:hypothetical protein